MQSPLPLHRRARTWYGQRSAPAEPLRHAETADQPGVVLIPALRIAQLALQIRKAPVHGRLTALL
jgi:ATP/maltotriose-dependent transcriptional regulator MalT